MNTLVDNLKRAVRDLKELNLKFALIGGFAVSFHTSPRTTEDIDFILLAKNNAEIENLVRSLHSKDYKLINLFENTAKKKVSLVRLLSPNCEGPNPNLDLLFNITGIEQEIVSEAIHYNYLEIDAPIASIACLIAMKLVSENEERLTDRQDLISLIKISDKKTILRARELSILIANRGYSGGKDLNSRLDHFVERTKKTLD